MPASDEFERDIAPYRQELVAYCYRMLGSIHDAEDAVQETYLRAWRFQDGFEGRASMRGWLYRIATNVCMTALERRGRRPLPSELAAASDDALAPLNAAHTDVRWLQPVPDSAVGMVGTADPAAVVVSRESIRLAFVAALQQLPARQRSVLLLRDVLAWKSHEVAGMIGTTTDAVNGMLKRARMKLASATIERDEVSQPTDPEERAIVDRYVAAFERADVPALMALIHDDAVFEMPPLPTWFAGSATIGSFFATRVFHAGNDWRMIPTRANGQPATAAYLCDDDGQHRAHSISVLTVRDGKIARVVAFLDTGLFAAFGLPQLYADVPVPH
jgi:RNA polymerase sigma-70 factor (ECF subfamily)